jgi:spore maturation protein CgeB
LNFIDKSNTVAFTSYPLTHHTYLIKDRRYCLSVGHDQEGAYLYNEQKHYLNHFDLFCTVDKSVYYDASSNGVLSYHMPLGVDPEVYRVIPDVEDKYKSDILIIGTIFNLRRYYIATLNNLKGKYLIRILGNWIDRLNAINSSHITWIHDSKEFGDRLFDETIKFMNGAKIILTINRDYYPDPPKPAIDKYGNTIVATTPGRFFMEAATKTFQLIDDTRPEIYEYYEKNKEVITFNSSNDLIEKIDYYMSHPEKRKEISEAAYNKTIKEFTWDTKIDKLLDFMRKML